MAGDSSPVNPLPSWISTGEFLMLRSMRELHGYAILAIDGIVGDVADFHFDDRDWGIHYLVIDTGRWLDKRKILLSRIISEHTNSLAKLLISVSRQQIVNSLSISTTPRSGIFDFANHEDQEAQWNAIRHLPHHDCNKDQCSVRNRCEPVLSEQDKYFRGDPHLHSSISMMGYQLRMDKICLGIVSGFLVDDDKWVIRYIIIDTNRWRGGAQILIEPHWVRNINSADSSMDIGTRRPAQARPPGSPFVPTALPARQNPSEPINFS